MRVRGRVRSLFVFLERVMALVSVWTFPMTGEGEDAAHVSWMVVMMVMIRWAQERCVFVEGEQKEKEKTVRQRQLPVLKILFL